MDVREQAAACGLLLSAPDEPEFPLLTTDYVVRQYPLPGIEVPRGAVVTLWFGHADEGDGDGDGGGGGSVREPRVPRPPHGGLARELNEPGGVADWAVSSAVRQ